MMEEVAVREPTVWREKEFAKMFEVHGVWEPPEVRQVPPIAKQPPARLIPLNAVVVEFPRRRLFAKRFEEVAEVPVAFV